MGTRLKQNGGLAFPAVDYILELFRPLVTGSWFHWRTTITGGFNYANCTQARVHDAAMDAGIQLFQVFGSGHHGGQFVQVAVIDYLKQFFIGPGSRGLLTQGIQDE